MPIAVSYFVRHTITVAFSLGILILSACSSGGDSSTTGATTPTTYTIGGTVSGLATGKSVVLQNNGGGDLTVAANGAFSFSTQLANNTGYAVTVHIQPAGQHCTESSNTGTVSGSNVTNVTITCSTNTYTIGGTISGLDTGKTVVLQNNSGDNLAVAANGSFVFATPVTDGSNYSVTVLTNPAGQSCLISNGSGPVAGANVTNISIACTVASGSLDTTFNNTGIIAHDNASGATIGTFTDVGTGIVIDNNGKILVTGYSSKTSIDTDMVVWRYNADGTLDTTFNGTGFVVSTGTAGGTNAADAGQAIKIDGNGKILVAGYSTNATGNYDMVIWRFNTDGTPDTSFNTTGYVVSNGAAGGNSYDAGLGMTTDTQGNILVTGYSMNADNNSDMAIWRYTSSGTLDNTFNGSGVVIHKSAAGQTYGSDSGSAITTDSSGNIVVTGYSLNLAGSFDMVIWRYTPGGALDTSFNSAGFVVNTDVAGGGGGGFDSGNSVTMDANDKIVVAGTSKDSSGYPELAVWRFNSNGTLDTTFNSTGYFVFTPAAGYLFNTGTGVVIDSSNRIVVSGISILYSSSSDIVIMRLNNNGTLDNTFGTNAVVSNNGAAGGSGYDGGAAVVLDSAGKILVTGTSTNASNNLDMVAIRLNP